MKINILQSGAISASPQHMHNLGLKKEETPALYLRHTTGTPKGVSHLFNQTGITLGKGLV